MCDARLKQTHPQKYYLRIVSKVLFYLGFGNYWYEGENTRHPRLYAAWRIFIIVYVAIGTLNKTLAYLRTDLSDEVKQDIIRTGLSEVPVVLKMYIMIFKRNQIRDVLEKMLEEARDIFASPELEAQAVKKAKFLVYLFVFCSYAYLIVIIGQSAVASIVKGDPFQLQESYFPTRSHVSFFSRLIRIILICNFFVLVTMLLASECLCIMSLIFVAAKFQQVQKYFLIMGEDCRKDREFDDFKQDFISGIKLHENALWCARNVQNSLGYLYGIQISITIVLLGICLLNIAVMERTLTNMALNLLYFFCLTLLTGCYMVISGDITHEAAAVAPAVFHCGWERVRGVRRARALLVVTLDRAQRPVYMTAFGFLILSHRNFVNVLRAAYSFFALVINAQFTQ